MQGCPTCRQPLTELFESDVFVGWICPNTWCWFFIENGFRWETRAMVG